MMTDLDQITTYNDNIYVRVSERRIQVGRIVYFSKLENLTHISLLQWFFLNLLIVFIS